MDKDYEKILGKLRNVLYHGDDEIGKIDDIKLKKVIYETLREALTNELYQFYIGSYSFDITPQNLVVAYTTPDTRIEITRNDIHFETTRQTPTSYFVISPEKKDTYPEDTKSIAIYGDIIQYDDFVTTEQYVMKLHSANPNDSLRRYVTLPKGFTLYDNHLVDDPTDFVLGRDINKYDLMTDLSIFFNPKDTFPVFYDEPNHIFKRVEKKLGNDTYAKYLPTLEEKKNNVRIIYSTIVEFYNEYLEDKRD